MKKLYLNSFLNIFRLCLIVIVPLIISPYISELFGVEGVGKIDFSKSVISIFTLLATLGIYNYGLREGIRVRDDKEKFSKLAKEITIINFISLLISVLIFTICLFVVPQFNNKIILLLAYAIQIPFTALGMDWVYGVYEEYKYITLRQIIIQILFIVGLFLFVKTKDHLIIYILLNTITSTLGNVWNIYKSKKYINWFKKIEHIELKKHVKPILILFSSALASQVYSYIDTILLGLCTNDTYTGYYSIGLKVNTILITFFTAISPVFIPRLGEAYKNENKIEFYKVFNESLVFTLMLSLPAVIGCICLSREIILVLSTKDFLVAQKTFIVLMIVVVCQVINVLFQNQILITIKQEGKILLITVLSSLINVLVSLILIWNYKDLGVAIGSLISTFVGVILTLVFVKKSGFSLSKFFSIDILKIILSSLIIIPCCLIACKYLTNKYLIMVVSVSLSILLYFILILLLRVSFARNILNKIISKFKKS